MLRTDCPLPIPTTDDYIEVSLASKYRYNPLHNDLDAYALAYGIATLMTNLFGKGKEPFWHQASTNLVKFVMWAFTQERRKSTYSDESDTE